MLLILIPIAWLAVLTVFVAVCRIAADADAPPSSSVRSPSAPIGVKLVLSGAPSTPASDARRPHRREQLKPRRAAPRRRRVAAHGIR
jgi:hypothetical protein